MSPRLHRLPQLAVTAALCTAAFLFARAISQQSASRTPPPSTERGAYFPAGLFDGFAFYISDFLARVGEPSLLTAEQDSSALSYRFNSMSFVPERMLAVRLSLNPDGSARIFATEESGTPRVVHRTQKSASVANVHKFLRRVEKADFWSMLPIEPDRPDAPRRVYKMDASIWVFEGVRNGNYHVVLRRAPESSAFTQMVDFLIEDLAKLDESAIPPR
jgi:hypothetical protein